MQRTQSAKTTKITRTQTTIPRTSTTNISHYLCMGGSKWSGWASHLLEDTPTFRVCFSSISCLQNLEIGGEQTQAFLTTGRTRDAPRERHSGCHKKQNTPVLISCIRRTRYSTAVNLFRVTPPPPPPGHRFVNLDISTAGRGYEPISAPTICKPRYLHSSKRFWANISADYL